MSDRDNDMIRRGDALEAVAGWEIPSTAISALPAVTVGVRERVQHKKRGSTYRVLGRGKVQTDTPLSDYAEVVVYQGEADGLVWVRPVSEFDDGRFAALDLTPARQCDHPYCGDTCGPEQVYGIDPQPAPDAQAVRDAALREATARLHKLAYWLDTDAEVLADMDQRDLSDHQHIQAEVNAILALLPKGGA